MMYTCAYCAANACGKADHAGMPANCPMRSEPVMRESVSAYAEERVFHVTSSEIEGIGYCRWPRLREVMEFCRRMDFKRIGMAFCRGLRKEAREIARIMEANGLEVVSVICKAGGIAKEDMGIPREHKVRPEQFEPICNPVAQAKLLNEQRTQFNVAVGLCVGHDSLFFKYSEAPVTVLVAKDRVTAHNPLGAVYCSEGYFKDRLTCGNE